MKTRKAFTLVELLTVIGILAILIGMAVLAYKYVAHGSRTDATRVTMASLDNLLTEFRHNGGNVDAMDGLYGSTPPVTLNAPTNMREAMSNRFGPETIATHRAIRRFATVPLANQIITDFPRDAKIYPEFQQGMMYISGDELKGKDGKFYRVQQPPFGQTTPVTTTTSPPSAQWNEVAQITPLLVDSDHNIILFVPSGGLVGVTQGGTMGWRITSTRPLKPGDPGYATMVGKPFFVSPGHDGDYATGDDNQYSFSK